MAINAVLAGLGAVGAGTNLLAGRSAGRDAKRAANRLSTAALEAGDFAYNRKNALAEDQRDELAAIIDEAYSEALGELRSTRTNALATNRDFLADSRNLLRTGADQATGVLDKAIESFDPYSEAGVAATNEIRALLGLGGQEAQTDAFGRFEVSPDYQFRFEEGQRAIDSSAAAAGSRFSGGTLKALADYGQRLASQEYGNYHNRLSGVADRGLNALQSQGNLRTNHANLLAMTGRFGADLMDRASGRATNALLTTGVGMADTLLGRGHAQAGATNNYYDALLGAVDTRTNALTTSANVLASGGIAAGNLRRQGQAGAVNLLAQTLPDANLNSLFESKLADVPQPPRDPRRFA